MVVDRTVPAAGLAAVARWPDEGAEPGRGTCTDIADWEATVVVAALLDAARFDLVVHCDK